MRTPQPAPALDELLARMGSRVTELGAALSDTRYTTAVASAQRSYRHWDKLRRVARDEGLDAELLWLLVKLGRAAGSRQVALLAAGGVPVTYLLTDTLQHETMLMDQELAGHVAMGEQLHLGAQRDRFVASSLMEEAIASSMLEGAATTVGVAKDMLRRDRKPRTKGERMVANNYKAIQFTRDHLQDDLSPAFLIELQRILTTETLERPDECGRLRRPGEIVLVKDALGEVVHEPPNANELEERLGRLCAFANGPSLAADGSFTHPFVRAALLHFQLGYDHPFCDGNGRTARAVFYWSMLRSGYWMFEFLPISRLICRSPSKYGMAFLYTESDSFDVTYFLHYHARIAKQAREELKDYLAKTQQESLRARAILELDPDFNDRQRALLLHALQHPQTVYTIEGHRRSHAVVYATARSDLLKLVERGYLRMARRGKMFEFVATAKLTDRPFDVA